MVRGGNGIPWMPTRLTPPTPAGFMQAAQHLHEGAGNDDDQCIILATGLGGGQAQALHSALERANKEVTVVHA
eukprot:3358813-Prorocentrum_lima.AAC.1